MLGLIHAEAGRRHRACIVSAVDVLDALPRIDSHTDQAIRNQLFVNAQRSERHRHADADPGPGCLLQRLTPSLMAHLHGVPLSILFDELREVLG